MCANSEGSGETARMPSLVAYVISTIISWAGSILFLSNVLFNKTGYQSYLVTGYEPYLTRYLLCEDLDQADI